MLDAGENRSAFDVKNSPRSCTVLIILRSLSLIITEMCGLYKYESSKAFRRDDYNNVYLIYFVYLRPFPRNQILQIIM